MQKNDVLTGIIEDLTINGEGIARVDSFPFFIKDTVVGDVVQFAVTKLKKTYGYGHLQKIISPSPDRVTPACPLHRRCGGCTLQSMSYEAQLRFKEKKVYDSLMRLGGVPENILQGAVEPILPSEKQFRYRNKAQVPFGNDKSGRPVCGFYAARSHEIVPCTDCMLGQVVNKDILETILDFMEKYHVPGYDETEGTGVIRHVLIRSSLNPIQHMICIVINENSLPHSDALISELAKIPGVTSISCNINQENTNVILGDKTQLLWGSETITDTITIDIPLEFEVSPHSFLQVNPSQTARLYSIALDYANLTGSEIVWDLYCGIGTISLFAAKKAGYVVGVESNPQAISDAKRNADRNGIENAAFICGKAEQVVPKLLGKSPDAPGKEIPHGLTGQAPESPSSPDVVILDPPRKGCDPSCLDAILSASPSRIVYVSCDPATLSRDIKTLRSAGYELRRFRAVDQFCQGVHVETVCLLSNRKPDSYVHLNLKMEDYYRIKDAEKEQGKK